MVWDERVIGIRNGYEIRRIDNGLIIWWEVWNPEKLDFKSFSRRKEAYAYCDGEKYKIGLVGIHMGARGGPV